MAMTPVQIADAFVNQYYQSFDTNRAAVANFYDTSAKLSFEGTEVEGREAIQAKLTALPFQKVQHVITTRDVQIAPSQVPTMIVKVLGQLKTDNDPPHGFSQVFLLVQQGDNIVISNEIFRLHLHHQ